MYGDSSYSEEHRFQNDALGALAQGHEWKQLQAAKRRIAELEREVKRLELRIAELKAERRACWR